jgi:hypothetical protein
MHSADAQGKTDISTLPARGHFYFALTRSCGALISGVSRPTIMRSHWLSDGKEFAMRDHRHHSSFAMLVMLSSWFSPLATAQYFTDDFEGGLSNWIYTGPGTATPSAIAYSGSRSVLLAVSSSYPWQVTLAHNAGSTQFGSVSVYVQNGVLGSAAALGITDISGNPIAEIDRLANGGSFLGRFWPAPGAGEIDASSSSTTSGWHKLEIVADSTSGLTMKVDGTAFFMNPSVRGIGVIALQVWGAPSGSEYFDDFSFSSGCQVHACVLPGAQDCVDLSIGDNGRSMQASYTPSSGLFHAGSACGFQGFDWIQIIEEWPTPSRLYAASNPNTPLTAGIQGNPFGPPAPPFNDPYNGGYTYPESQAAPFGAAYPFYYNPLAAPLYTSGNTLTFFDRPSNSCLPGGSGTFTIKCAFTAPLAPAFMHFKTELVGILSTTGMPSNPLYQWEWSDNFNGTVTQGGGVFGVTTANWNPVDPGSGTGGITITSVNGVQQTPPSVSCGATPTVLWPPNGKSVLVTVSGIITPGTSGLAPGGTAYAVMDEYGQVQPSGGIALATGGAYSFGVSLIAARNGNDQDGRTYTIVVGGKDKIGNIGSCSAVVTVPHDQGH